MRYCLRVEKARGGQNATGAPDEDEDDTCGALAHSRSQRVNDSDEPVRIYNL